MVRRSRRHVGPALFPLVLAHKPLKPAIAIDLAVHAIIGMAREQPFRIGPAEVPQGFGMGFDGVSGLRERGAGGQRFVLAFHLYQAHAAHRMGGQAGIMAKRRYFDTDGPRRIEQRATWLDFDVSTIDCQPDHPLTLPAGVRNPTLTAGRGY